MIAECTEQVAEAAPQPILFTNLAIKGGDGVLERILFPIVQYSMIKKREKPSQGETTENELQYSIPGAP